MLCNDSLAETVTRPWVREGPVEPPASSSRTDAVLDIGFNRANRSQDNDI